MGVAKIIGKVIIIPILFCIFVGCVIYFLIKYRRDRKREKKEDAIRAQQFQQQQQYVQYQTQQAVAAQYGQSPYYHQATADDSTMKRPEPVFYPVQAHAGTEGV
ncbi:hypothetical protein ASPACDRAFT_59241 [Aspergillus aculeatus ATCC 16872]|uniref:Uncharacterized protein n=1 Tax=Aspergillus aculeatus (strain ATCC 16872 / CBS 172.66 / WB 5094) TaxID=690307 RepID=A0A1L9WZ79_ASPA1|nr:uncharacterized protein ASPACDRAFT_59241 [Aspergillus aculeatus ATCC 16872]OJK01557.1 hypothetical protein ASPACDRAFT_59241 [Aspergillus aculeatus ATCC 16872]